MTSNVGSQIILNLKKRGEFGFQGARKDKAVSEKNVKDKVMEELHNHFKPEFLNRIDEIIIFHSLAESDIEKIVELQLERTQHRLAEKKITLVVDEKAKKYLAKEGYDPDYGARPLKRVLQTKLLDQLALKLIEGSINEGDTVSVSVNKDVITLEKIESKVPVGTAL